MTHHGNRRDNYDKQLQERSDDNVKKASDNRGEQARVENAQGKERRHQCGVER